jgi:hypothetical protein
VGADDSSELRTVLQREEQERATTNIWMVERANDPLRDLADSPSMVNLVNSVRVPGAPKQHLVIMLNR